MDTQYRKLETGSIGIHKKPLFPCYSHLLCLRPPGDSFQLKKAEVSCLTWNGNELNAPPEHAFGGGIVKPACCVRVMRGHKHKHAMITHVKLWAIFRYGKFSPSVPTYLFYCPTSFDILLPAGPFATFTLIIPMARYIEASLVESEP